MNKIRYQAMLEPKVWTYLLDKKREQKHNNPSQTLNFLLNSLRIVDQQNQIEKNYANAKKQKEDFFTSLEKKYEKKYGVSFGDEK